MEFPGYIKVHEPQLHFNALAQSPYHTHPLQGLIDFGPYSQQLTPISTIRIGVICPAQSFHIIQNLYAEFFKTHQPRERRAYLRAYTGIENIFRLKPVLLDETASIQIDSARVLAKGNKPYINLSQEITHAIRTMSVRKQDFDILFIYLPEAWSAAFEDRESNFDLHDFIKATTAVYNIPTQIIRESKAIHYPCRCSVMWRLSIALYVKAGGVPWKLTTMNDDVAFIGLSYSTRYNAQTQRYDFTTCCSQVFDSDGTGLEFIAYDVGEIDFHIGENPFLTRAEMRRLMSKSISLYQRRHAGRLPKRLIVHKNTHFTSQEMLGASDAINSNVSLELLQIVENTNWRAIKYQRSNQEVYPDGYPVERGCYLQTGPQEIMIWTQGVVNLNGKSFFKEGKNIPAPLIVKRFVGDGGWDLNCQAIIGLTKMNWNHDSLYDRLPVTLGYAKVLATTIKRMSNLVNKPYEFRFFM